MTPKHILPASVIFGLFFSCAAAFAGEAEKYFPLAVGNTWVFQGEHYRYTGDYKPVLQRADTLTVRISETKETNGKIWYRLENGIFGFDGFFRTEGDFVYGYNEEFPQGRRFYDFTRYDYSNNRDPYFMALDGFCASVRELKTVAIPLGTFETYHCNFNLCDFHPYRGRYLAPDIGMVRMDNSDDMDYAPDAYSSRYTLIYARVNGVEYPGPVTVSKTEPFPLSISNRPNPFNQSTSIPITLPEDSAVTLSVYDIQGRKVRTLAAGLFHAGSHSVLWDGADDSGHPVSSGVYFSRMVTKEGLLIGKMLLMK